MKPLPHLLRLLLCLPLISMQSQGDSSLPVSDVHTALQDQVVRDSLLRWEEQIYLHTDRDRFDPGEALFFKAYVFNGPTQKRFSPSGVLRLELWDAQDALVASQYHPVREGWGEGVLRLPRKLEEGTYELRAYTRWMQNYGEKQFFRKVIRVGDPADEMAEEKIAGDAVVSFYPEGGKLLAGVQNRLIVRMPGSMQLENVGEIIDGSGSVVLPIQPYSEGFGMAIFMPESGEDYQFRTPLGDVLDLPEIFPRGYALKANNLATDKISLEIQPTPAMGREPVVLKGERAGQTYFIHLIEFDKDDKATLDIPKEGMPAGFMNFSLTGLDDTVWAERQVWIGNHGNLNIEAQPLDQNFSDGARTGFRIRVTDSEGNPVKTHLSVGVTDAPLGDDMNLIQYLNPVASNTHLQDDRGNRFLEDLRAWSAPGGTNGRDVPAEIRYPVQRSLELHGSAYDLDNNLLVNTEIQMLASSDSSLVIRETKTDASGVLHLDGLEVVGETQFIFRTKGDEQEQRLVKIIPVKQNRIMSKGIPEVKKSRAYSKAERKNKIVEPTTVVPFDTTGVIVLDEATIAKRREQQKVVPSLYGLKPIPKDVVVQDPDRPLSIESLAQRIPGVQYRMTAEGLPAIFHTRRGGGGILWVVDGQIIRTNTGPVPDGGMMMTGSDPFLSPLTFLTPADILRMEFYIDIAQTSMFGLLGASTGVMVVYTRSGSELDYTDRKEGGLYFKGYEPAVSFDDYLSDRRSRRKYRKDPPSTLYWNPSVETDGNGEAVIRFESPAEYTQVHLAVETLTRNGLMGSYRETFRD
jgi:hypothetical protein